MWNLKVRHNCKFYGTIREALRSGTDTGNVLVVLYVTEKYMYFIHSEVMLQHQYMLSIMKVFRFQRKTFLLLYWLRLFLLLRVSNGRPFYQCIGYDYSGIPLYITRFYIYIYQTIQFVPIVFNSNGWKRLTWFVPDIYTNIYILQLSFQSTADYRSFPSHYKNNTNYV